MESIDQAVGLLHQVLYIYIYINFYRKIKKKNPLKQITASCFAIDVGARPVAFNCNLGLTIFRLPKSSWKPRMPPICVHIHCANDLQALLATDVTRSRTAVYAPCGILNAEKTERCIYFCANPIARVCDADFADSGRKLNIACVLQPITLRISRVGNSRFP